ncbi:MAG: hypothetical protein U1C74_15145 [Phenylobacterium sp.]|nr:hypothetical protein [Phenylobacterium sp.]
MRRPADAAAWLGLAATPTFGLMAWLNAAQGAEAATLLCSAGGLASPLGGMTAMYGLMAAFHAGPWLRLIRRPDPA